MSDNPTPRAVLAWHLNAESIVTMAVGERLTYTEQSPAVAQLECDYLAALVASVGPLTAERLTTMQQEATAVLTNDIVTPSKMFLAEDLNELRTAYTTLAAECAQVMKERDRWMGRFDNELYTSNKLSDENATLKSEGAWMRSQLNSALSPSTPEEYETDMVQLAANAVVHIKETDANLAALAAQLAAARAETAALEGCATYWEHEADVARAERDALRATVATLQDALKQIKCAGDKSSRYVAEDALELLARTPTSEGQG